MIVKRTKVSSGIRIQSLFKQSGNGIALYLQGTGGNVHHPVEAFEKILLVRGLECNPWKIDRNDANGTGTLPASEETARLLPELPQIQTKTAAHTAHITRSH